MQLRAYSISDLPELMQLFYDTVREINVRDYSSEQITAWTDGVAERKVRWAQTLETHDTLVAVDANGAILGFADIDAGGYLDHLYIHKNYQRQGIATALCNALEAGARTRAVAAITTHASITAMTFFLQRGYRVIKEQRVMLNAVSLTNFIMEKRLNEGD